MPDIGKKVESKSQPQEHRDSYEHIKADKSHPHTTNTHTHTLTNRLAHTPNRIPEVEISAVAESGKKGQSFSPVPLIRPNDFSSLQDH